MSRATGITRPFLIVSAYYGLLAAVIWVLVEQDASLLRYAPVGGLERLGEPDFLEPVTNDAWPFEPSGLHGVVLALLGAIALTTPLSWIYLLATPRKDIDASFAQTIILLPILVAGIAIIVQHSLALAFSLAGVVAAVRFRFSLDLPSHALYVFAAIGIGLAAGVSALEVAAAVSVLFVYATLLLWRLDYGDSMRGWFMRTLSGRDEHDE